MGRGVACGVVMRMCAPRDREVLVREAAACASSAVWGDGQVHPRDTRSAPPSEARARAARSGAQAVTLRAMPDEPSYTDPARERAAWSRASSRRSPARVAGPWILGAAIILIVALVAGLATAYIVATFRAVPVPPAALLPTPRTTPTIATQSPRPSPTPIAPPPATAAPATPEPSAPPGAEATPRVHIVASGENLFVISVLYDVTLEEIIELNDLQNPNLIVPGQMLLIPPPLSSTPSP